MASQNEALLEQADNLWKMLDDLADTDPSGYRKLIDNIMKEQLGQWKPPEPVFCLRTSKLESLNNCYVFINICKWEMVSKPRNGDKGIAIIATSLRNEASSGHSVMDICLHNDAFGSGSKDTQDWQNISYLALDYVADKMGINLSRQYKILSVKYKGDFENLKRFFFTQNITGAQQLEKDNLSNCQKTGSVIHNLSNVDNNTDNIEQWRKSLNAKMCFGKRDKTSNKPLIEEVAPTKISQEDVMKNVPEHIVETMPASVSMPRCIMVRVSLPKVKSGVECELDVSKTDLLLISPHYSQLRVQLPYEVNEDNTTSIFNKKTCELTIKIPLIES